MPPAKKKTEEKLESKANDALKKGLKNKLRAKMKMLSVGRHGGTRQEVQSVLNKFNEGDDEKMALMKDIQEDVKGMKQKDAKKYLQKVIGAMDPQQTDSFVETVKDKLPGQSQDIVNYVARNKKLKKQENESKPQVNPETVYVPVRQMTEEQKQAEIEKRKEAPLKKKKKSFRPIAISIPKISDLRKEELSIDVPAPEKKPQEDYQKLTKHKRLEALGKFNPTEIQQQMREHMFQAADVGEVIHISSVESMLWTHELPVPDTEEFVSLQDIPERFRKNLSADWTGDGRVLYRKVVDALNQGQEDKYVKVANAYESSSKFILQFIPILRWLRSLKDASVPLDWLIATLYSFGILQDAQQKTPKCLFLRIMCDEFLDKTQKKVSVSIVPFVKILVR